MDVPACTNSGYDSTLGGWNSAGSDDAIFVIWSGPQPLLLMVSNSSTKELTQTLPKPPWLPVAVAMKPHGRTRISHAPRPKVAAASSSSPTIISPWISFTLVFGSAGPHFVQVTPRSKERYRLRSVPTNSD